LIIGHNKNSRHSRAGALVSVINRVSSPKNRQEAGFTLGSMVQRLDFISSPVRKPGVARLEATAGFLTRLLNRLDAWIYGSSIILVSDQNFEDDTGKKPDFSLLQTPVRAGRNLCCQWHRTPDRGLLSMQK